MFSESEEKRVTICLSLQNEGYVIGFFIRVKYCGPENKENGHSLFVYIQSQSPSVSGLLPLELC